MMDVALYSFLAILLSICISFLPKKALKPITSVFSFGKNGLRKMRRRRDTTDTVANVCLGIALLFSLFHWLIPASFIIYGILLLVSFLCVLAWTNKISAKMDRVHRMLVLFDVSMMFFFGLFSALGCFNGFVTFDSAPVLRQDIAGGKVFEVLYFLHIFAPMMVLLQGILYMLPMYCMWAQFKYMRLENTYKSRNIGLFTIKILFICLVMVTLSYGGIEVLNWAYYIDHVEV